MSSLVNPHPPLSDYGYFLEAEHEFVITTPHLPQPWVNYLSNAEYCALITHTGGGYSFLKDPKTQRILAWDSASTKLDRPGRYIFVRDQKSGELFSTTWQPLRKDPDHFSCHVGIGYQHIESTYGDLHNSVTYFVPPGERCEVWHYTIQNNGAETRDLSVYGFVEWLLGCIDESLIFHQAVMWNRAQYDDKSGGIIARKTVNYEKQRITPSTTYCFFGSSARVDGFDCNKDQFLGTFNDISRPETLLTHGQCQNSYVNGDEAIGVLQSNFFLKSGESKTIVFVLGAETSQDKAIKLLYKYKSVTESEKAYTETQAAWAAKVQEHPLHIETPDPGVNLLMNSWAKYQTWITAYWCRSAGMFNHGRSGQGYRDNCHDAETMLLLDPSFARKKLLHVSTLIRRNGTCAAGWSETFGATLNQTLKDHAVWFTSAVFAYVKETGDLSFLEEKTTWLKSDAKIPTASDPDGNGSIWEKLTAQLEFSINDTSVHGLLRMGMADWNESLDAVGLDQVGESVWLSQALVWALRMAAELAQYRNEQATIETYQAAIQKLSDAINTQAWDGQWYLRGYTDEREPFGSNQNTEGKLYLNTQSWAILADLVPKDRLPLVLKNIDKYLEVAKGYTLFYPAYTLYNKNLGLISMFSPGEKDNAGVMSHAQTFMLAANAKLNRPDIAYRVMQKNMPNLQKDPKIYQGEPYAYAQFIVGPDHPYHSGAACFSWMTGSAGWTLWVLSQWIFGLHPELDGLRIDPKLPSSFKHCKITRAFRGDVYEFEFEAPGKADQKLVSVTLDGQPLKNALLRPVGDGKKHRVVVTLG